MEGFYTSAYSWILSPEEKVCTVEHHLVTFEQEEIPFTLFLHDNHAQSLAHEVEQIFRRRTTVLHIIFSCNNQLLLYEWLFTIIVKMVYLNSTLIKKNKRFIH